MGSAREVVKYAKQARVLPLHDAPSNSFAIPCRPRAERISGFPRGAIAYTRRDGTPAGGTRAGPKGAPIDARAAERAFGRRRSGDVRPIPDERVPLRGPQPEGDGDRGGALHGPTSPDLAAYLLRHAERGAGTRPWALADLADLGVDEATTRASAPVTVMRRDDRLRPLRRRRREPGRPLRVDVRARGGGRGLGDRAREETGGGRCRVGSATGSSRVTASRTSGTPMRSTEQIEAHVRTDEDRRDVDRVADVVGELYVRMFRRSGSRRSREPLRRPASTAEEREDVYRFRYRVYVEELGFRRRARRDARTLPIPSTTSRSVLPEGRRRDRGFAACPDPRRGARPVRARPQVRARARDRGVRPVAIDTTSRFMLDPRLRHGTAVFRLMEAAFEGFRETSRLTTGTAARTWCRSTSTWATAATRAPTTTPPTVSRSRS